MIRREAPHFFIVLNDTSTITKSHISDANNDNDCVSLLLSSPMSFFYFYCLKLVGGYKTGNLRGNNEASCTIPSRTVPLAEQCCSTGFLFDTVDNFLRPV